MAGMGNSRLAYLAAALVLVAGVGLAGCSSDSGTDPQPTFDALVKGFMADDFSGVPFDGDRVTAGAGQEAVRRGGRRPRRREAPRDDRHHAHGWERRRVGDAALDLADRRRVELLVEGPAGHARPGRHLGGRVEGRHHPPVTGRRGHPRRDHRRCHPRGHPRPARRGPDHRAAGGALRGRPAQGRCGPGARLGPAPGAARRHRRRAVRQAGEGGGRQGVRSGDRVPPGRGAAQRDGAVQRHQGRRRDRRRRPARHHQGVRRADPRLGRPGDRRDPQGQPGRVLRRGRRGAVRTRGAVRRAAPRHARRRDRRRGPGREEDHSSSGPTRWTARRST